MFSHKINARTELRLIQQSHCRELFKVMNSNRQHLRRWHPWIDVVRSTADLDRLIAKWLQQFTNNRGFHAGIWHEGWLCGEINHLNIDWGNHSTVLSYWLDERHQGRGIMTDSCRSFVAHAFDELKLHRVTIECAVENQRSRRIAERLGFTLEGTVRQSEWLHDHFADHAIYGLLKTDARENSSAAKFSVAEPAASARAMAPSPELN